MKLMYKQDCMLRANVSAIYTVFAFQKESESSQRTDQPDVSRKRTHTQRDARESPTEGDAREHTTEGDAREPPTEGDARELATEAASCGS